MINHVKWEQSTAMAKLRCVSGDSVGKGPLWVMMFGCEWERCTGTALGRDGRKESERQRESQVPGRPVASALGSCFETVQEYRFDL
jgi:hypothetical protein